MEKNLNITAIIQARTASTRLPNKVLKKINEIEKILDNEIIKK